MPTIHPDDDRMVGTLRFAHPTALWPSPDHNTHTRRARRARRSSPQAAAKTSVLPPRRCETRRFDRRRRHLRQIGQHASSNFRRRIPPATFSDRQSRRCASIRLLSSLAPGLTVGVPQWKHCAIRCPPASVRGRRGYPRKRSLNIMCVTPLVMAAYCLADARLVDLVRAGTGIGTIRCGRRRPRIAPAISPAARRGSRPGRTSGHRVLARATTSFPRAQHRAREGRSLAA